MSITKQMQLLFVAAFCYAIMSCNSPTGSGSNDITGTVTDIDGNVYQAVKIGNQVWMAEDLRTTKYNDGTPITFDTSRERWSNATTEKY